MGQDYIAVYAWATIATVLSAALPFLIRNDENPNLATILMALGAVINIVLDYLFIGIWDMGLTGAAVATITAQITICLIGLGYFLSGYSNIKWRTKFTLFNLSFSRQMLLLGSSSLFMYLYTSFVFALHNRLFMDYGSSITVGAFAIVGYLMVLYYFVAEGVAEGLQPPVSHYYGAEQHENISKMLKLSVKVTFIAGISWTLLLNLLPELMVGLFNSEDPVLISTAVDGIRMHLFAMPLDGFIALASVYFMATNQGKKALIVACSNMLIQLPFLYVLPKIIGVDGVWLAMPLSNITLCLVVMPMVYFDIKQRQIKGNSTMSIQQAATA